MTRRLTLLLVLLLAPPAAALPGDPPVTAMSPADAATLQISAAGPSFGIGCATYRDAETFVGPDYGFADDYRVTVSTGPGVGGDGVLADQLALGYPLLDGEQTATSTCHLTLQELQTPGTYYWQPWRYCSGCDTGKEVGPVRSFTLVPDADAVTLKVKPPKRAYAGFGTLVPITVKGTEARPAVTLQRRKGGKWVKVPSRNALRFTNAQIATFPKGRYVVRAKLTLPQTGTVTSPERTITVVRSKRGTKGADGTYGDTRYDLSAKVTGGGRKLKAFTAHVSGTCPIPAPGGGVNLNPMIISVALPTIRIAPDGRFAYALPRSGDKIGVSGRVHRGRLTGGVTADTGACSGSITAFSARR